MKIISLVLNILASIAVFFVFFLLFVFFLTLLGISSFKYLTLFFCVAIFLCLILSWKRYVEKKFSFAILLSILIIIASIIFMYGSFFTKNTFIEPYVVKPIKVTPGSIKVFAPELPPIMTNSTSTK